MLSPRIWSRAAAAIVMFAGAVAAADDKEFAPLYNGKDLTGWQAKDGKISAWTADGELLSCTGEGGGWLRTAEMYSDYVLRLDFRIPPGGNSGVGLRFPAEGDPAHVGMEVQILDDDHPQYAGLKPAQYTGGVYYQAAAKKGYLKPAGEWNSYEITCLGPMIKVVLNGTVINEFSIDDYTKGEGGYKPLSERPEIGYIGFQSHGSRVDFRNIKLKDLTKKTASGLRYADIKEGKGETVAAGARVKVHYTGRFVDGAKFDSSRDRKEPAVFPLDGVIKGWGEGIPGMKVGGRRKLIIPSDLAYGDRGIPGTIPPKATLIFDVELLGIE